MIACFKIFATGRLAIPFAMSTTANRGCFQKKKETQEVIAHTSLMSIASHLSKLDAYAAHLQEGCLGRYVVPESMYNELVVCNYFTSLNLPEYP
jgi:hypothetical protein